MVLSPRLLWIVVAALAAALALRIWLGSGGTPVVAGAPGEAGALLETTAAAGPGNDSTGARLTGRVLVAESGLAEVLVRLRRGAIGLAETRTDSEGRFEFEWPADARRLRLEAEPPVGYVAVDGPLRLQRDFGPTRAEGEPASDAAELVLRFEAGARPLFEVGDEAGRPVADQAVRLRLPDGSERTLWSDAAGRIVGPESLPLGPLVIELLDHGQRHEVWHHIEGGRARPIAVEARPGPRLAVDFWNAATPPRELTARLFAEEGGWGAPLAEGRLVPGSPPRLAFGPLSAKAADGRQVLQLESPDGLWYASLPLHPGDLDGDGPLRVWLRGRGRLLLDTLGERPPGLVVSAARATPELRAWLAGEGGEPPQAGLRMAVEPEGGTRLGPLDAGGWLVWLEHDGRRGEVGLVELEPGGQAHLALSPPR